MGSDFVPWRTFDQLLESLLIVYRYEQSEADSYCGKPKVMLSTSCSMFCIAVSDCLRLDNSQGKSYVWLMILVSVRAQYPVQKGQESRRLERGQPHSIHNGLL